MIQMQDITVFDIPSEAQSYEQRIIFQTTPAVTAEYKLAYNVKSPKKPEIVEPQTKTISPVIIYLIQKLKNGTLEEQERCISSINKNLETKGALQYLDSGITNALFTLVESDISKYKEATNSQKRLRKKIQEGKKLSKEQYQNAYALSDREKAEYNQVEAIYVIARIQNLLYKELYKRSGLKPQFYDLPAVSGLINEAKNNRSENVKIAAISSLGMIYKPEFYDSLKQELQIIEQQSTSNNVKNEAQKVLKYIEAKKNSEQKG